MKYKLGALIMVVALLLATAAATLADSGTSTARVHQHLTGRQPDAGCDCDGSGLCTHLPLVVIDTGGQEVPGAPIGSDEWGSIIPSTAANGDSMITASVAIMDDESRNHHPSDEPDLESEILIRIRGNSSRRFDKKNYLIRFVNDDGSYAGHEVMGMDAHYEWALHGPYLDKSLIRNYIWYNIAGEMMDYAPNVRFCEVILNGEYLGLYLMTETITNGEDSRVNISEPLGSGSNATGFVLRLDRGSSNTLKNIENFTWYTYRLNRAYDYKINIEYPRSGALTKEMADAIEQEFSDFEKALYSMDYDDAVYGYDTLIDVNSFVDYFIINEFTGNDDAGQFSTYIYKDIGGKYRMAVWDFNNACDNYQEQQVKTDGILMRNSVWMNMLTRDEEFDERIISRYRMWRESVLSEEYLLNYIDETVAFLGDAIERNFEVWGYSFEEQLLLPASRDIKSFDEAISQLKEFITERGDWLDEYIEVMRQYGHPSATKKYNH